MEGEGAPNERPRSLGGAFVVPLGCGLQFVTITVILRERPAHFRADATRLNVRRCLPLMTVILIVPIPLLLLT